MIMARLRSYGTWLGAITTESYEAGSKASTALLAEATQTRNAAAIGVAHRAIDATLLYGGLFREAKRQFDEATSRAWNNGRYRDSLGASTATLGRRRF
jgi:Flp pilus assembly protein TadD